MGICLILLVVLRLIVVHGADGQRIEVNIDEISSIREPRQAEEHFGKNVHCVLTMTNAKFNALTETCAEVDKLIRLAEEKAPD